MDSDVVTSVLSAGYRAESHRFVLFRPELSGQKVGLGTHRARHRWCRGSSERCIVIGRSLVVASPPKRVRTASRRGERQLTPRRDLTPRTRSSGRSRSGSDRCPSRRTSPRTGRLPPRRSVGPQRSPTRRSSVRFGSPRAYSVLRDRPPVPVPSLRQSCTTGGTLTPMCASLIIVHVVIGFCERGRVVHPVPRGLLGFDPRQPHRVAGDAETHAHVADDDGHRDAHQPQRDPEREQELHAEARPDVLPNHVVSGV